MWLDQVVLVLYRPWDVVNVAAVVRVMTNFGLSRLRLVEPAEWDPYRIKGIAHQGDAVIGAAQCFATLEAALADCSLVLGTTGRMREVRRERLTPRQAAPALRLAAQAGAAPVALLFGPERDGLPNSALDECHALVTIPTGANASLNLAQAALVIAYELWLHANAREATGGTDLTPFAPEPPRDPSAPPRDGEEPTVLAALTRDAELALGSDRAAMFAALTDLLRALYRESTDGRMAGAMSRLRAILLRAAPRADEARMLAHLFRHLTRVERGG